MSSSKKRSVTGVRRLESYFDSPGSSSVSSSVENEESEVSEPSHSSRHDRQQRKFLLRWKLLFPWVDFEDGGQESEKLYCRECRSANLQNAFAVGKDRPLGGWKKEYLQRHAISNDHVKYASAAFQKAQTRLIDDDRVRIGSTEKETLGLLRNVHFLVKNSIALLKASHLHSLVDDQIEFYSSKPAASSGLSGTSDTDEPCDSSLTFYKSPISSAHRSSYSTWEFVHALNAIVEENDIQSLRNARFYSLLVDESNDISTTKNLLIYCQFVNTKSGKLEVKFMKVLPLKECDAVSISQVILDFLNQNLISLEKLILFTSDGAAVMLGANNGVHVKLKEHCPHLHEYHCVAHREALAVGQAYQSISYYVRLESVLKAIYSHFSHSSCRIEQLKEIFQLVERKFVRIHKIYDIRWLSRYEAVNAIVTAYQPLLLYFENISDTDVTAEGLAKQMRSYRFFVTLHFLLDVLSTMAQLNKTFQIQGYHPYSALKKVEETCKALASRYLGETVRWGPFASKSIKQIEDGTFEVNSDDSRGRRGSSIEVAKQTEKDAVEFVRCVVDNLRSRFPDVELYKAAMIFDPSNLPSSDDEFCTYGEKEVELLCTTYSDFVDYAKCALEWDTLKQMIKSSYQTCKFDEFILKLATEESLYVLYPAMSSLAEIIAVFPASTAEVERGFSYQNAIKSKSRNRLSTTHLDQLLRLRLNSPETHDFPLRMAYKKWSELKQRRYVVHKPQYQDSDSD